MRTVLAANPRSGTHYLKHLLSHIVGEPPLEERLSRNPYSGSQPTFDFETAVRDEAPKRLIYDHFYFESDSGLLDHARYPDLRIIVLNRHPLDRFLSLMAYDKWQGWWATQSVLSYQELAQAFVLGRHRPEMRHTKDQAESFPEAIVKDLRNYVTLWLTERPSFHVQYEHLVANPARTLAAACDHLGLSPSTRQIEEALAAYSYESLSGGRKPGDVDHASHYRRGTAGEWRDVFKDQDLPMLRRLYGDAFAAAGYEI